MRGLALLSLLLLAGCATQERMQILQNLQGCERHYDGSVSGGMTGGQFSGTVKVDCEPEGAPPPVPPH